MESGPGWKREPKLACHRLAPTFVQHAVRNGLIGARAGSHPRPGAACTEYRRRSRVPSLGNHPLTQR